MGILENMSDKKFIENITSSNSLTEFYIKSGYKKNPGHDYNVQLRERCKRLNISPPAKRQETILNDEELSFIKNTVKESESFYNIVKVCKRNNMPMSQKKIKKIIEKYNIDTSHICGASYKTSLLKKISDEDFINIVSSCESYKEIGEKIGYKTVTTGTIKLLKRRIKELDIEYILNQRPRKYKGHLSNFSDEEFKEIISTSRSLLEAEIRFGYKSNGFNGVTILRRCQMLNITPPFTVSLSPRDQIILEEASKQTWTTMAKEVPYESIFCKNSHVRQTTLRRRYQKENITPYQCSICGLPPLWNGKPLTLTLDHINGINNDNRIENLRWVCPNCDRQLATFGSKNKKKKKEQNQ